MRREHNDEGRRNEARQQGKKSCKFENEPKKYPKINIPRDKKSDLN